MAIPTTVQATGFYAIVDFDHPDKIIRSIGYSPGARIWNHGILNTPPPYVGKMVVEPNPTLIWPEGNPANTAIRTPFEAFMQTIYGVEASLSSESVSHDLHSEMVAGGVTAQYAKVAIVDFMAFTGVLRKFQTLPNGSQVDLLELGPGDVRPNINDLVRNGLDLMHNIITHLGIQGIYPYLYTKEGISFEELCDYLREWIPDVAERTEYVYSTFIPILRAEKSPILTYEQIDSLLKE
jgi:hypothetical protein